MVDGVGGLFSGLLFVMQTSRADLQGGVARMPEDASLFYARVGKMYWARRARDPRCAGSECARKRS
ncbi:MAG: hypothetical protein CL931_08705 [Deltaproteobacteria bacterium]|nr:hypothetical protein [Deltaproteobacteria bacterium]